VPPGCNSGHPAPGAGTGGRTMAARDPQLHYALALAVQEHRIVSLEADNRQLTGRAVAADASARAAEEALRVQIEFMARVSHELRRPLQPILIAAETLGRAGPDLAAMARLRAIIGRQALQLARLVDDLLDVSRMATGKLGLDRSTFDLRDVIATAVEACLPAIERRGQRFSSVVAPHALNVCGDSGRLVQVLGNLLDNASRYTPEGGSINLLAAAEGDAVLVSVSDDGIGLSSQALPHIFEPFVQGSDEGSGSKGAGLGLGLAIVHELVAAHGGSVVAHSAGAGLGSCLVVTLPTASLALSSRASCTP